MKDHDARIGEVQEGVLEIQVNTIVNAADELIQLLSERSGLQVKMETSLADLELSSLEFVTCALSSSFEFVQDSADLLLQDIPVREAVELSYARFYS